MRILMVTKSEHETDGFISVLRQCGYSAEMTQIREMASAMIERYAPDVVMLDVRQYSPSELRHLIGTIELLGHPQFLGLVDKETLSYYDLTLGSDDFVLEPYEPTEPVSRLEQLHKWCDESAGKEPIKCGDLVVDLSRYEVQLGRRLIKLRLKEYKLLCFLASNQGKVFSREALLSEVWGCHYSGGARTVDVHIRKLRSKIDDGGHSFIETVRGVGYKFREGV